jgi:antibiotic biosynthesis monooxygenase (ABM) superfamily enzyme
MIVRVLNVRVAPNRGAEFHAFVRDHGLPRVQAHPGLISLNVGRRNEGADEYVIVVTVWRDWEALSQALGPDTSQPYLLTPETGLVESATVEHFEGIEIAPAPAPDRAKVVEAAYIPDPATG